MANNDTNNRRYYWIKLKDSFMNSDQIDFLMSQPNGAQYVVLYQMLCLATTKTNGKLSSTFGEIIIPYDIAKIQRMCKYFSEDTIRVALTAFQNLKMIYEETDGCLQIANYNEFIGSETHNCVIKRQKRLENFQSNSNQIPIDIDKDKDTDKEIEKERELDTSKERKKKARAGADGEKLPLSAKISNYDLLIAEADFDESVKTLLYEFIKMRKLSKKPLTDFALKKVLTKLHTLSSDKLEQCEILENSIINNWQDIYALRGQRPNVNQHSRKNTEECGLSGLNELYQEYMQEEQNNGKNN